MLKTTLKIKMRNSEPEVSGYLYTDNEGRKLFLHRSVSYKHFNSLLVDIDKYWTVSDATTGLGFGVVGEHTRKNAIESAQVNIKDALSRISTTWKQHLKRFPVLNDLKVCSK